MSRAQDEQIARMAKALRQARSIIAGDLHCEIESYALPEKKRRNGSIKGCTGSFYNSDTIDHVDAARYVRRLRRALKRIDEALG